MNFQEIYDAAVAAGKAAAGAMVPRPMAVQSAVGFNDGFDWNRPYEVVNDGVCGFAWVSFAGNEPFGRWAKKAGIARKGYPKGLQIWISDYNQSMQRKEAHAYAMAEVLRGAGVIAYAGSRMD